MYPTVQKKQIIRYLLTGYKTTKAPCLGWDKLVRTLKLEEVVKESLKQTMLEFMLFSIFVSELQWEITRKLANFADYTQLYVIRKKKPSIVLSLHRAEFIRSFAIWETAQLTWAAKEGTWTHQQLRHPAIRRWAWIDEKNTPVAN